MTASLLTLVTIGLVQLLAVISPGPSFLITAQTAVARSRLDGVKIAFGLGAGTLVWSTAALLGLNVLFRLHHWLFVGMKIAGALFLLWIAIQIFRHAHMAIDMSQGNGAAAKRNPFLRGFLTQISNPKVAVFFGSIFVAIMPKDVPGWMMVALAAIFTINEISWYTLVSLCFGSAPVRRFYLGAKKWIDRVTGFFLGALSFRILWQARDGA
jgi:threonine/homoserine/homoserine lactone efflux protein